MRITSQSEGQCLTAMPVRRQRGTQIAELALVLPLLAFLALVVSEGAAFIRVHQVINNAAREGARLSSLAENRGAGNTDEVCQAVARYASNNGVTLPSGCTVGCPAAPAAAAQGVFLCQDVSVTSPAGVLIPSSQVVVQYQYGLQYLPKIPFFGVASTIRLTGSAEFQNFN